MLVVGAFLQRVINNDNVIFVGTYAALISSIMGTMYTDFGVSALSFMGNLPFVEMGMGWVVPTVVGCCIGALWRKDTFLLKQIDIQVGSQNIPDAE